MNLTKYALIIYWQFSQIYNLILELPQHLFCLSRRFSFFSVCCFILQNCFELCLLVYFVSKLSPLIKTVELKLSPVVAMTLQKLRFRPLMLQTLISAHWISFAFWLARWFLNYKRRSGSYLLYCLNKHLLNCFFCFLRKFRCKLLNRFCSLRSLCLNGQGFLRCRNLNNCRFGRHFPWSFCGILLLLLLLLLLMLWFRSLSGCLWLMGLRLVGNSFCLQIPIINR